jgi:Vault protein inter-alpha-trypsin domain/PEP-CTERM motif
MPFAEPRAPGAFFGLFAVGLPLLAVVLELVTGVCADLFFDPLPGWGHLLLVLTVPLANFLLLRHARNDNRPPAWLTMLSGAAIAVAALYALALLPLAPFALVALILFGLGLLAFAPLLGLISTLKLLAATEAERVVRRTLAGAGLAVLAFLAADLPASATQLALRWQSNGDGAGAASLMRALGDEDLLLRLCYGGNGRAAGPASFLLATANEGLFSPGPAAGTAAARELYFRATGRPFGSGEPEGIRGAWAFDFDGDLGGEAVGARASGLTLAESRIDGSVAAADNLAYLEWTAVFANVSEMQREARLTLALPEGAVASRATLWVNGEPREASVAGRAAARAAYENVVTVQRRDPLLVTTDGAGRLLVQAFPIQPGSRLKLRIGLTAPLAVAPDGRRSLALPAIADRNFELAKGLEHQLWIEADAAAGASGARLDARAIPGGTVQLRGRVGDEVLAARRPRIRIAALTGPSVRTGVAPAADKQPAFAVEQTIERAAAAPPTALHILLDGSSGNRAAAAGLKEALASLPAGLPVSLTVASAEPRRVETAPWSAEQRARLESAIDNSDFAGGEDNLPALADALDAAQGSGARLLWIHGPQPIAFAGARARLDQLLERRADLPGLIRYQAEPGPAFTISGNLWFETARAATPGGDPAADLAVLLAEQSAGQAWRIARQRVAAPAGATASPHIARLWAAGELAAAAGATGKAREEAIALAHRLNIVTPVSGAVVLETDREYGASGLPVPGAADVPTVPEPGTWALLALGALVLVWFARRRRWRFPAFAQPAGALA